MAKRKPTGSEIVVNTLIWIAMALSVIGLFIYGGFQISRWWKGKSFHFFKLSAKKEKATTEASVDTLSEETVDNSENSKNKLSCKDFLDLDIKADVDTYLQELKKYNAKHAVDDEPPVLNIDYTPTLHELMTSTNKKAYEGVLMAQRNAIIYHLQTITSGNFNFVMSNDSSATAIVVNNPSQELLDYYAKLPKNAMDARTSDEFFEIIIKIAVEKYKGEEKSLMIDLEPQELATHPLYQSLNLFIKLSEEPGFKQKALNQLFLSLQTYIYNNYNQVELLTLLSEQKTIRYGIPKGPQGRYQEDEVEIFLTAYRKKSEISHSADPTFSAKGAKKVARRKSEADLMIDKGLENPEEDSDSVLHSAP